MLHTNVNTKLLQTQTQRRILNKKLEGGPGQYFIAIEQNMRDSIIKGVESIGVKIKEGEPIF